MSGVPTTAKGVKKKPAESEAGASYGLRRTRDRTLLDMVDSTSRPSPAKRGPLSPHKEKVTNKVFVTPSMVADQEATPHGRVLEIPTQAVAPEDGTKTDPMAPADGLPTNPRIEQQEARTTRNSLRDTAARLAEIITMMNDLCTSTDIPKEMTQLVAEAYDICMNNNLMGESHLTDMIQRAKLSSEIEEKVKVCGIRWPKTAYKITNLVPDSNAEVTQTTIVFTLRGQPGQLKRSILSDRIPALTRLAPNCPEVTKITCTEEIGDSNTTTQVTHVLTLDEEGTDKIFLSHLTALRDQLTITKGPITLKTTTGHHIALRKACELALTDLPLTSSWQIDNQGRALTNRKPKQSQSRQGH